MSRHPRRKQALFAGLASCLSLMLSLAASEIYVRAARPKVDLYRLTGRTAGANPMDDWAVVDAFCAYRTKPGRYAVNKTVNAHGFVSTPEIARQKPEGTIRLVFLGGSSTAGTGHNLCDTETWPWQTVEMIREQIETPVDFINAAVGGYSSFESYGRLWSRLRHFAPDMVIVSHGWNEMYYFSQADNITSWRRLPDGSWSIVKTRQPMVVYSPLWIDPAIRGSQVLSQFRIRLSQPRLGEVGPCSNTPLQADFNHDGLPIWRTNLKLIQATCEVLGAQLFVAKQPTLIVSGLGEEARKRCRYRYHGFDHDAHVHAFSEIYRIIDEEIPADSVIDLTSLSGRDDYFFDHVHPRPGGCTEIAKLVSEALVPFIRDRVRGQCAGEAGTAAESAGSARSEVEMHDKAQPPAIAIARILTNR